jgi:hypothetical protein
VGQQRIDRSGSESDVLRFAKIDANFDDVFDIVQVLNANYVFLATVAPQQLFNGSPNGAINLPVGLFEFECMFDMTGLSATSSTFGFALGGSATLDSQKWQATANKNTRGTQANGQSTLNTTANAALTAASTTKEGWAYIYGMFRVSAAGTVIPQVSFSVITNGGQFPVIQKNSYFRVKKLSQIYTAAVIAPPLPTPSPNMPFWS